MMPATESIGVILLVVGRLLLKTAAIVTEQWIQIQHFEQALQIAKMSALKAQRERFMRCTLLKLQALIKQEMERSDFTSTLANKELVFFLAHGVNPNQSS